MNVSLTSLDPLPSALNQPCPSGSHRRHRIGDYEIDRDALRHFNELLQYLDLRQAPLDSDQVASAARELVDNNRLGHSPACIQQRIRRGAAIDLMVADPDWETREAEAIRAVGVVVDYLRGSMALIPKRMPVVGHLDDAIVVETAWPSLVDEVREYLAFCRLRRVEAALRGETRRHFGFTRAEWQAAARAEAEWIAHCARVSQDSYLMRSTSPRFRIS